MSAGLQALPTEDPTRPRPGRHCPAAYRYPPRAFDRPHDFEAETLYVAGGLYGNVEALEAILAMAAAEAHPAFVDALPGRYDSDAFMRRFLANWPGGFPAHESSFGRIADGPNFSADRAAPRAA